MKRILKALREALRRSGAPSWVCPGDISAIAFLWPDNAGNRDKK